MSSKPKNSDLQRLRAGRGNTLPIDTAAGHSPTNRVAQRRGGPGVPLGDPPRGRGKKWAAAWRRAAEEWPQLEARDRAVLADYLDMTFEREAAREDVRTFGRLDAEGKTTGAYRVFLSLHDRVAKLRRDLAATTSTRERVPIRKPQPATVSTLEALKKNG